MQSDTVIGWDLGGAHLKAALADGSGRLRDVMELPCPLWHGLDVLTEAVDRVLSAWHKPSHHTVTMTGELADIFPDRATGVKALVEFMVKRVRSDSLRFYAGCNGLVDVAGYTPHVMDIASANWLASTQFVAERVDQGLFIDIGSTTTDIIPFRNGKVLHQAVTDASRLQRGELVYTGVVRTPVCAVVQQVPVQGEWQPVTAELFSTMSDVYRLMDSLPEAADKLDTPDGQGKGRAESARRLARMVGLDTNSAEPRQWHQLASFIAHRQAGQIRAAVERALSRNLLDEDAPIVGAGIGRFLIRTLAEDLQRPHHDFAHVCKAPRPLADAAACCAPAVALALLRVEEEPWGVTN